jgi:hypothetical protein
MISAMRILVWLALAACNPPSSTSSVSVRAFAAPRDTGNFVVFYHPWSAAERSGAKGRGSVEVLTPLDGIELSCANVQCERRESHLVVKSQPPPGLTHLEVVIAKPSFETVRVNVPIKDNPYPVLLVLMKGASQ